MSAVVTVTILGDDASLQAALKRDEASLASFAKAAKAAGDNMQSAGRAMTHGITVPVVAAAAEATKMAYDFQQNVQKVINLSQNFGQTAAQVSKTVLSVSSATGQSAKDLADAYYKVAAAGYTGNTAQSLLAEGAKMAAVGMGSAADTTDALISVINVYGEKNMSAAKAADIFTSTIQNSKFAAADLSTVLGRVLPVAANLGVSFQDLGGDLAALSHTGLSADQSVTGLTALFSNLIAATKSSGNASKEISALHLSAQGLLQDLGTKGSIATLNEIKDKLVATGGAAKYTQAQWKDLAANMGMSLDDVKAKFGKIDMGKLQMLFPNKKAFLTFLGLTDENNEAAQSAAKNVGTQVTGTLEKIFGQWSKSDAGKMTLAVNQVKNAFIEVGDKLLPKVAGAISSVVAWWNRLSDSQKSNAEHWLKIAAEIGPVLLVMGKLVSTMGALAKVLTANPLVLAAAAIALLYMNSQKFRDVVNELVEPIKATFGWLADHQGLLKSVAVGAAAAATAFGLYKGALLAVAAAEVLAEAPTYALAAAWFLVDAALNINPVVAIITAIGLLAAAIYEAWQKSETFRQIMVDIANFLTGALVDSLKVAADYFTLPAKMFLESVKAIISAGDKVLGWFHMSLPDSVKNGVNAALDGLNALQSGINSMHGTNLQIGVTVKEGTVDTSGQYDANGWDASKINASLAAQGITAAKSSLSGFGGGSGPLSYTGGGGSGGSGKTAAQKAAEAAAKAAAKKAAAAAKLAAEEALATTKGKPLLDLESWLMGGLQNTGKDGPVTKAAQALAASIKKNYTVKGGVVPQAATDAMNSLSQLAQQASSFNTSFQSKLAGGADFVSVFKGTGANSTDIKMYLTQQIAGIKRLGSDLKILAARGVPPSILQMLANAGVDGVDQADSLVNASASDMASIIGLGNQITTLSRSIANSTEAAIFKPTGAAPTIANSATAKSKDVKGHTVSVKVNNADAKKIAKEIALTLQNLS